METKVCTKCHVEKELSHFAHKRNKYSSECKDCHNIMVRQHYKDNRDYYLKKAVKNTKKTKTNQKRLIEDIKNVPCCDCKITYPWYVMEFDHVRGVKIANVSEMIGHFSWKRVQEEIHKCDVVCANCHRKRTFERQGVA